VVEVLGQDAGLAWETSSKFLPRCFVGSLRRSLGDVWLIPPHSYWADPAKGIVGIIGTNVLPFLDEEVLKLYEQVEKAAYA
jgi:hypothetical protein